MREIDATERVPTGDALFIDGMNITYRVLTAQQHARPDVPGEEVAATAAASIRKWFERCLAPGDAKRCVVVFDGAHGTARRRALYPAYKAGRGGGGDALAVALPLLQQAIRDAGSRVLTIDDEEADDVIATYARKTSGRELLTYIVSSDRDLLQALNPFVELLMPPKPGKKTNTVWNDAGFIGHYGFVPERLADYKAITGDVSDNIDGAKGLGDQAARKLLRCYPDGIDEIYAALGRGEIDLWVRGVSRLLRAHETQIRANLEITRLRFDVPLPGQTKGNGN